MDKTKEKQIESRTAPPGEVVYEAVYREGEHELERSNRALAWSGLAAGLSMGFSFVTEALLCSYLPPAHWLPVVCKFGYTIGFIIVILGRQQLFTKNTLTVILPLLNRNADTRLANVARLWMIVLASNMLGAFLFAWLACHSGMFEKNLQGAFSIMSGEPFANGFSKTLLRAIPAGWLVALMIWLMPFAETARLWVVALLAYVVGLGQFPHIVAEAVPAFYRILTGKVDWIGWLFQFFLPVLAGNVIGGVALVAAAVHAEFLLEGRKKT